MNTNRSRNNMSLKNLIKVANYYDIKYNFKKISEDDFDLPGPGDKFPELPEREKDTPEEVWSFDPNVIKKNQNDIATKAFNIFKIMMVIQSDLEIGNKKWKECQPLAREIVNNFNSLDSDLENFNKYLKLSTGEPFLNALKELAK